MTCGATEVTNSCRRSMVGRLLAFACAFVGATSTADASIDWTAPAGCPDAKGLRSRVEQRLDQSLDEVEVDVDIQVSRRRGQFVATVDLGALTVANDVRTLTSPRCTELADAVAVIIARVANDVLATRRAVAQQHAAAFVIQPTVIAAHDSSDEPSEHVDQPAPVVTSSGERRYRPWSLGARVSGVSGIGIIPKVGLGAELAITLRAGTHLAELGAARWVRSVAQFHDGAPAKVQVDLDVTVARYGWRPPTLPLRAWVSVEVGQMTGGGFNLPGTGVDAGRWIAAGTGFGIAWQMTPWARLFGGTEAMVAVERVRFKIDGMDVYAPAPMSFRTTCGLEVGWQ
jgi:hypothetical protein